jgi:NTE family protein
MSTHIERVRRALVLAAAAALVSGCASLQEIYKPAQTVALTADQVHAGTSCTAEPASAPPPYDFEDLRDCTSPNSLVVFAFSGGGIRSASFGYGALKAAHSAMIPDAAGSHPLDRDIDIVSGVSGGSFTAAAFANQRDRLFPEKGAPDYYRDNFLTRNFFGDLISIYLAPWHWQWMLPGYATNDEMAKVYASVDFSSRKDKLFAATFGDLAKKGRPLLVIQATDFGNEQPFVFTQNDFDLICSDANEYPVGNAIAASSAFPVLFSPIQLTNHHFTAAGARTSNYCHAHRPAWVDRVLAAGEPDELSRSYVRAKEAESYLPPRREPAAGAPPPAKPQFVHLQDGGVTDNVALRGLMNIVALNLEGPDPVSWGEPARSAACRIGLGKIEKILIVAVDGEARSNNQVSSLPYLSDLGLILNVATSAAIDSNGFETMIAAEAMTRKFAAKLEHLDCSDPAAATQPAKKVEPYFARVSFQDLADGAQLDPGACGKGEGVCLLGDLARSATSLDFAGPQVDALIEAGRSAFLCNPKVGKFLRDSNAAVGATPAIACERSPPPD